MKDIIHYQYYHSNALLLVNTKGHIRVLYTPFRVLCVKDVGDLKANSWTYVEEVLSTEADELQYVIFGKPISYKHFDIPVMF